MDRCRRSVRLGGLTNKRDTPVKPALSRRNAIRRFLPSKHYEALPEESGVDDMNSPTVKPSNPAWVDVLPVHSKSAMRLSIPAFTRNLKRNVFSPAVSATKSSQVSQSGQPHIQVTVSTDALKDDEMQSREDEERSVTSSSMEPDTTFSSDDEDEDLYSFGSSSSLPSPEIFRNETHVETPTLKINKKPPGLHLHIKNSTLLDESHAKSINMHCSPNLSTIIDTSTILAEQNNEIREPEPEAKPQTDLFKSDNTARKTPTKLTSRRPILCKKKVWFKSPVIAETKHVPASRLTLHNTSEPFQTPSPRVRIKHYAEASRSKERSYNKQTAMLKRSPEKPKFFDFLSDSDRDAFFQKMSKRSDKLRSFVLFPLIAAKHK
ncbi:uncharacterized protein LOC111572185 [Amphiprion ocellaris]|uniref:uncharacterized protein LOC111572185 n=1 Tax=Amphiprion ocellaris TaxID=80972 RepID=UPI000C3104FB|nr:uncharacterized protein LOC111572185 [Amphiprion ocellaris]